MALPDLSKTQTYFDPTLAMWPELLGRKVITPVRIGVDRNTGKVLMGWDHVQQSIGTLLATGFHERVLRRYCGSFVPHILGESAVARVITRFYWAIASAIDLWEPCYRIKRVLFMNYAVADAYGVKREESAAEQLRLGNATFRTEGVYRPRGHLGDITPQEQRTAGLVGRGSRLWDVTTIGQ